MEFLQRPNLEWLTVKAENVIQFPHGLFGFESIKEYVLLSNPNEEPFLWLQVLNNPNMAFLAISPFIIQPDYRPDLEDEDVQFLNLTSPTDALLFTIVTLRRPGPATVNLKGPIVLNRHTLVGKQVIPKNAPLFLVQHPIPVETQ